MESAKGQIVQELVLAAQNGYLSVIKKAYEEDALVLSSADNDNCSLLHWAAIVF